MTIQKTRLKTLAPIIDVFSILHVSFLLRLGVLVLYLHTRWHKVQVFVDGHWLCQWCLQLCKSYLKTKDFWQFFFKSTGQWNKTHLQLWLDCILFAPLPRGWIVCLCWYLAAVSFTFQLSSIVKQWSYLILHNVRTIQITYWKKTVQFSLARNVKILIWKVRSKWSYLAIAKK